MKPGTATPPPPGARTARIPLWVKIAYSAFMAVLIPVYLSKYGPGNFIYFCDLALLLTLAGMWMESAALISMCCVGILLPQALWCVDFIVDLFGGSLVGMTSYMFRPPAFLRALSFFHGWLPFLLIFLVRRTGYCPKALPRWTALAWAACLIAFFFIPGPVKDPAGDLSARNVNFVFGFSETTEQSLMPRELFLVLYMAALAVVVYWPTHLLLKRFITPAGKPPGVLS